MFFSFFAFLTLKAASAQRYNEGPAPVRGGLNTYAEQIQFTLALELNQGENFLIKIEKHFETKVRKIIFLGNLLNNLFPMRLILT